MGISNPANGSSDQIRTLLGIVVMLAPYGILFDSEAFIIMGILVQFDIRPYGSFFVLGFLDFLSVPSLFLRILFVHQVIRLYNGITTKKNTIILGIFSEMTTVFYGLFISFPVLFIPGFRYLIIGLPVPILLVTTLILVKYRKPPVRVPEWLAQKTGE